MVNETKISLRNDFIDNVFVLESQKDSKNGQKDHVLRRPADS